MKKSLSYSLAAGALAAATWFAASPAIANPAVACGAYRPGLIAFVTGVRPATCVYQGPYIVNQGPTYSGPAIVAPQPTYSPSPTVNGYVPAPYRAEAGMGRRVDHAFVKKSAKNERPRGKGKVQIVHARAEVRIYGPERMEIRLYRR